MMPIKRKEFERDLVTYDQADRPHILRVYVEILDAGTFTEAKAEVRGMTLRGHSVDPFHRNLDQVHDKHEQQWMTMTMEHPHLGSGRPALATEPPARMAEATP